MSEREEFEYNDIVGLDDIANYLSQIAEGFLAKRLQLQGKGQMITMIPGENIKLEVKAERKENKGKLDIGISWKEVSLPTDERLKVSTGDTDEPGTESE